MNDPNYIPYDTIFTREFFSINPHFNWVWKRVNIAISPILSPSIEICGVFDPKYLECANESQ